MAILRNIIIIMGVVEIKTELKSMIENETDLDVLEAVKTLLQRT